MTEQYNRGGMKTAKNAKFMKERDLITPKRNLSGEGRQRSVNLYVIRVPEERKKERKRQQKIKMIIQ